MREVLYVSDRKLASFINERRIFRDGKIDGELELSMLELFKLKLSGQSPNPSNRPDVRTSMKKVDQVLAHLDRSEQPPLWYEDDAVRPGRWVQFELELAIAECDDLLLMYPTGIGRYFWSRSRPSNAMVLIHGSVRHIVGRHYEDLRVITSSDVLRFVNSLPRVFKSLGSSDADFKEGTKVAPNSHIEKLVKSLRESNGPAESGIMAGFARVTAIYDIEVPGNTGDGFRILCASPLYVERV